MAWRVWGNLDAASALGIAQFDDALCASMGAFAIDSIRGSLLSSYSLIWAWLFISLSFFIGSLFNRRQEAGLPLIK